MPDPDLVIRTSGEQRISNFLLWQIAYAEIFVTDRLWPDFRGLHLLEAIADYQHRDRRFGGLGETSDEKIDTLQPVSDSKPKSPKSCNPRPPLPAANRIRLCCCFSCCHSRRESAVCLDHHAPGAPPSTRSDRVGYRALRRARCFVVAFLFVIPEGICLCRCLCRYPPSLRS